MTLEAEARVEVRLNASRICFLSGVPCFRFILFLTLHNSETPVIFLKDGFKGIEGVQSINSDQVVQCFDDDSGEQLQVFHQGPRASFLKLEPNRGGYVSYTTFSTPRPYELIFDPSSLLPDHRYRLCFTPTASITHWPSATEVSLSSLSRVSNDSLTATDIPKPSKTRIAWDVISGNHTISFKTRPSPAETPTVNVSLSAPSTFSLSNHPHFTFTLTFSTDSPGPITVLTERGRVRGSDSDLEILDAISGFCVGPERIDDGNIDGPWQREEFLRIDRTYTETRKLDATRKYYCLPELQVGKEYILRILGGEWSWWTEDTVDEVMTYAGERGSMGLGKTEAIKFASAGEEKFRVVE